MRANHLFMRLREPLHFLSMCILQVCKCLLVGFLFLSPKHALANLCFGQCHRLFSFAFVRRDSFLVRRGQRFNLPGVRLSPSLFSLLQL